MQVHGREVPLGFSAGRISGAYEQFVREVVEGSRVMADMARWISGFKMGYW